MDEKQQALVAHRDLQAGLRAREELISTFRLKKNKEVDRVEHLKEEHRALDKMLFRMMFFLKVQYNSNSLEVLFFLSICITI